MRNLFLTLAVMSILFTVAFSTKTCTTNECATCGTDLESAKCAECNPGFIVNPDKDACVACITHCDVCPYAATAAVCTTCKKGYGKKGDICAECGQQCATAGCTLKGAGKCDGPCDDLYTLLTTGAPEKVDTCAAKVDDSNKQSNNVAKVDDSNKQSNNVTDPKDGAKGDHTTGAPSNATSGAPSSKFPISKSLVFGVVAFRVFLYVISD